jgi:hypothetical protein
VRKCSRTPLVVLLLGGVAPEKTRVGKSRRYGELWPTGLTSTLC